MTHDQPGLESQVNSEAAERDAEVLRDVPDRHLDPLLGKMWKTKSARFNGHVRLHAKHSLSTIATSILAFYIFAVSLLDLVHQPASSTSTKMLGPVVLIISVFLIMVTLFEHAKGHERDAVRMHQCALEISELYNRFQSLPLVRSNDERMKYNGAYSDLLKRFELNHKDIDFMKFQIAEAKGLKISGIRLAALHVKYSIYWMIEYGFYFVLIVVPPLLFLLYRHDLGW